MTDALDKFLKSDGMQILIDSDGIRTGPYEPLTVDDVDDFAAMDLESLSAADLEDLLEKAEDLVADLEERIYVDKTEKADLLGDRISETEDFIDRIQDRLDELEKDE